MNIYIKSSQLKGISIAGRDIIISQLADDTALFLKDQHQIPVALKVIDAFSKASGLYLNINKCGLLSVKDCQLQQIANVTVIFGDCYFKRPKI